MQVTATLTFDVEECNSDTMIMLLERLVDELPDNLHSLQFDWAEEMADEHDRDWGEFYFPWQLANYTLKEEPCSANV